MKNITLKDLIDLGVINVKKKKNKKNKKKKQKQKRQIARGYEMGGLKSDSSHMQSYLGQPSFNNSSNLNTEIQHLQRQMLEDQIKNPDKDRFKKEEPQNNLLTIEDFSKTLNPIINRVRNVEKVGNQLLSDLHYGEEDFIGNYNYKTSKIKEIPDNDIDETNKYYDLNDGSGIITDNPYIYFPNQGNSNPYQEIDVNNTPQLKSHYNDINNTPKSKSIIDTTQETLSKFFNINKKADENSDNPQPDVLIPENEKKLTPKKETNKSQKEIIPYVIPEIIPVIEDKDNHQTKYIIEPSDAIPINYVTARARYKKLLIQFYPNYNKLDETDKTIISNQIDEIINPMNLEKLRNDYKEKYAKVVEYNEKIENEKKIENKKK
jgi:hypothetical protein